MHAFGHFRGFLFSFRCLLNDALSDFLVVAAKFLGQPFRRAGKGETEFKIDKMERDEVGRGE